MHWIAPSEKDTATATLEKRLWDAADQLRANSGLKAQEYSGPILGLIFLRFADVRFWAQRELLAQAGASSRRGSRVEEPAAYHAAGVLFLSSEARFDFLLTQPESLALGAQVNGAMREIEKHNPQLAGVLPTVDAVVAALPDTPRTRGFVGNTFLAALRPGAILVNVGRGTVVDEGALVVVRRRDVSLPTRHGVGRRTVADDEEWLVSLYRNHACLNNKGGSGHG